MALSDVRPQFVVSPLLITRCAEECQKQGLRVGFPQTKRTWNCFNGVEIIISGVGQGWLWIPDLVLLGCFNCPDLSQFLGFFGVHMNTMIKTHVDCCLI